MAFDSGGVVVVFVGVVSAGALHDCAGACIVGAEDVIDFVAVDTCVAEGGFEVAHVASHGGDGIMGVEGVATVTEGCPGAGHELG